MHGRLATTYDRCGRLVSFNASFAEAFGPQVAEWIGRRPPYPWWPEDRRDFLLDLFERVLAQPAEALVGVEMVLTLENRAGADTPYVASGERLANGQTTIFCTPVVTAEKVSEAIELLKESLVGLALSTSSDTPLENPRLAHLSPRERSVFALLIEGSSTADIADALYVSIHTVRNHRKAIYRKLGVSSQVELMRTVATI